jgi:hypothetical protein
MDQVPYYPYADTLAKQGYIVGLLTTETALLPSHPNFAQDLIFVYNKLISESNANSSSPFYQKVIAKGAIGGHSMGGGSTVLSCQYSNPATCYFTFAAANTNPSSITAAPSMTKPYLSFAGSRDCIAPVATNQKPMYDSSGSACKFLINITDALHCQFGSGNLQCNFGEGFSGCASSPLSRNDQINKTLLFLVPYLNYYLKGDCSAWTLFETRYAANTDVMYRNCTNTVPSNASISGNNYFCNGSSTTLSAQPASFNYLWSDNSTADTLGVSVAGNYSVVVGNGVCSLAPVSVSVTENFPPAAPSAINASDTVCSAIANIAISVTNNASVTSYNWTLPSGWSITSGNNTNAIEATSDVSGGIISVSAENACGSASVQKAITVIPSNLGAVGAIAGDSVFCEGAVTQFFIAPVNGSNDYVWTYPAGWSVMGADNSDTVMLAVVAGSGSVGAQARNECGQSIASVVNVVVNDTPQVLIAVQGNQLVSQTAGSAYQWYRNGVVVNGETNASITPGVSGNYSLMVSGNGCSGVSQAVSFIFNGIDEMSYGIAAFFPNPNSTGSLQVPREWAGGEIKVFDVEGRVVLSSMVNSMIDISSVSPGVYFVCLHKEEMQMRRALVVQ